MSQKKVSIVILTWNKLDITKKCLKYLEKNTENENLEIIIVDNGSKDGTQQFLKELESSNPNKYKIILNSANLGYAKGVNQGIKISTGRYILLLNNDIYVLKNWLNPMINILEEKEQVAIVGAKLIYPKTSRVQHAGIVFLRKIEPLHIYKNCSLKDPKINKFRFVDGVTGACMLIKREIFEKIGLFDEGFKPIYFEDTDFCLRCRIRGHKIAFSQKSIAIHDERISSSQFNNYNKIFKNNYEYFLNKWAKILDKYNDISLRTSFKVKIYIIYGIFKTIPKKIEFIVKKWLSTLFSVK